MGFVPIPPPIGLAPPPPPLGVCPETGPRMFLKGWPSEGFLTLEATGKPRRPLSPPPPCSVSSIKCLNLMLYLLLVIL